MKRLLTFVLSVGFFIWLPNAFADDGGLSLDSPSSIRQTQGEGNALLTLTVDNIQVRAGWEVVDDNDVFDIDQKGVLKVTVLDATDTHVATVYAVDRFDLLNDDYVNLTASAVITVVFLSGEVRLPQVPRLTAVAEEAVNLYTFVAIGGDGAKTYTLLAGDENYFSVDADSGVLALSASVEVGEYTLTVQAADEQDNIAQATVTVGVSAVLSMADAPLISVALGEAVSLYTFIATGGIGIKTYTLLADDENYFSVNADSGVLSLLATAKEGVHTLTVQAIDKRNRGVDALATVRVSAALSLADAPPFTVIASMAMSLHTFVASDGIGVKTYTLAVGDENYFSVDADSGVLSLSVNTPVGEYMLIVQAKDEHANTVQAVATVGVSAVLSLADAKSLGGAQGIEISLHTFVAQGGIGARTYTLLTDNVEDYFSLDAKSGVLFLLTAAPVATYTLSVQVKDERGNTADALATVGVLSLYLADALELYAIVGREVNLHTFDAKGVNGVPAYTIEDGDDKNYFSLDSGSGVLAVRSTAAIGVYTLSVSVEDENNRAEARAVVEVRASLSLAAVPPLTVIVGRVAHTLTASGGIGAPTYTIADDDAGSFALDATSGVLSLRVDAAVGRHLLTVLVMDERKNTVQAVVTVGVSAVLSLADVPRFTVIASMAMSLHTFAVTGGIGVKTYMLQAGDDGAYFSMDVDSGVLSLSVNTPAKEYTLTVQVMDARNNTAKTVVMVGVSAALSLADAPPPLTVIASMAMSLHTFVASGGIGVKTYILQAGDGGKYFSIGVDSGVLSLSVNTPAKEYTLTVQVMDARNNTVETVAMVGVSAALVLADAPRFTVIASVAMSLHTFAATGGIGVKTYTLRAGDDGAYFAVGVDSGVLSLSLNAPAKEYRLTVQAIDKQNNIAQVVVMVGVSATLALADAPPLTVIASVAMSLHTFAANGGIGVKTYTLLASDDGVEYFTLDAASGVLSLTVNAPIREYTLTVQATDGQNNTVQAVATVEVSAALVLADDAPRFTVIASVAMSLHTFAASGGIGIKTYTLLAGDGVEYFAVGVDSGVLSLSVNTPAKEYTLTVQAIDEQNNIAQVVATVGVSATLALADAPPLTVIASVAMSLHTFAASGGIGVKTYTLRAGDGVEYFTLDAASGVLSLSVNAPIREYTLTVQATDEQNNTVQAVATVEVAATLVLADAPPFTVIASVAMSLHTFAASGGVGVKTYTLRAGDGVEYFSVNATSGVLSLSVNTPVKEYTLTVQAADEQNNIAQAVATVGVSAVLALADVPSFTVIAVAMSLHTFAASGGVGVKTYTLRAGDGGEYFSVNAASGVLSLTVNAPIREYTLTVLATDEGNNTAQAVATVVVSAALLLADAPSFTVIASVAMSLHTFAASGGIGVKTYTLRAGDDEGYFSVGVDSGVLSLSVNTPAKEYRLTVQAIDEQKNIAQVVVTVGVSTVLSLADAPLLTVLAVAKGVYTFAASGGIGAKTYTLLAGDGVEYFSVDAASGVLSLSVNVETGRKYTLTVQVMDGRKVTVQALATVEVAAALVLAKAPLLVVENGLVMSLHTFAASGGVGVKTYIIAAGNKDGYFVIDSASGVLSATNAVANFYILSVQVSDSQGNYVQVGSTVEVWGPLSLADAPPLETFARLSAAVVLHTYKASGGLGAKRYTMITDGSGYFAVGADSGELSLPSNSDMRAGTYNLLVEASDSLSPPQRVTAAATVRIVKNGIFVMGGHYSNRNSNDVWSSLDGEVWRRQTGNAGWPERTRGAAVSHNGLLYVLGGTIGGSNNLNDVWSSEDGRNWTLRNGNSPWEAREQFQAVSHNGRLHVLSGSSSSLGNTYRRDAWSSDDGETWVLDSNKAWGGGGARRALGAVSHNGRLYVMGGHRNGAYRDVWSSVDGKGTWSFEGNAEWPSRARFEVVSHNGRMYVIGGDSDGGLTPIGDVWSSADGKNWVQEKENTDTYWGKRYRLRAVSHNGLLYVVGGRYEAVGGDLNARDVWSSADGKSWTIVVDNVQGLNRSGFGVAVFPPPLVLWGVGEAIMLNAGVANTEIHKFTAQYGVGQYTYKLLTDVPGFSVDGSSGVLSADSNTQAGLYTLTVQVKDEEETEAETAVKINVVASSTAALSAGSSGISPPASGGGASAKALAEGGISLHIIAPPASSLSRPRTPPTSAGGENIGEISV